MRDLHRGWLSTEGKRQDRMSRAVHLWQEALLTVDLLGLHCSPPGSHRGNFVGASFEWNSWIPAAR